MIHTDGTPTIANMRTDGLRERLAADTAYCARCQRVQPVKRARHPFKGARTIVQCQGCHRTW